MSEQEKADKLAELAALKKEMQHVHGTKCEVYSRVVGYLRPVQNWNKGKKEEFAMRKVYKVENPIRPCCCDN